MANLYGAGIETRPIFYPMHVLPPYRREGPRFSVAERLASSGINLPSGANLSSADVEFVATALASITNE